MMLYGTIEVFHQVPSTICNEIFFSFVLSFLSFYMSLGAMFRLPSL